jgi:hypothetical protein
MRAPAKAGVHARNEQGSRMRPRALVVSCLGPLTVRRTRILTERHVQPSSAAGDSIAEIIALYRRDVDASMLRSRLALTPEERLRDVMRRQVAAEELQRAGRALRKDRP